MNKPNNALNRMYYNLVHNNYFNLSNDALWIAYELGNSIQSNYAFNILKKREKNVI